MKPVADTSAQRVLTRWKPRLLERLTAIDNALNALERHEAATDVRRAGVLAAHQLAGCLGTLGSPEGSAIAAEIEDALVGERIVRSTDLRQRAGHLRRAMDALYQTVEQAPSGTRKILLIGADKAVEDKLQEAGDSWRFEVVVASDATAITDTVKQHDLRGIIVDASQDISGIRRWLSLSPGDTHTPVVALTGSQDLDERLELIHGGATSLIDVSAPADQLFASLSLDVQGPAAREAHAFVVDDDEIVLAAVESILRSEGLGVTTVSDPSEVLNRLALREPDVVILDVGFPDVNGIDLCRLLRSDSRWSRVPIMFLTASKDRRTRLRAYSAGADDLLSKPIDNEELVVRLRNRLELSRRSRAFGETDAVTGLATRGKFQKVFAGALDLAKRRQLPLSFALLDLDNLKVINDSRGHDAGDTVLRCMATGLRTATRSCDVVGRWGGDEFALGLLGTNQADAIAMVTRLQKHIGAARIGSTEVPVQFSAGVAELPTAHANLHSLYRAADAALYKAKQVGRGAVVAAVS